MLKITSALEDLVNSNWMIQFGLHHNLFNLTRLAKFIQPIIKTRTKKELSLQALLMAISRYQRAYNDNALPHTPYSIKNISLHSGLATLTYSASQAVTDRIHKLHAEIKKSNGYFTLSESTSEITLILKNESLEIAKKIIHEKTKNEKENLSAIGIRFDADYSKRPGFLYYILQFISLQGINIYEISSTFTEIVVYVDDADIRLAFDTLIDGIQQE